MSELVTLLLASKPSIEVTRKAELMIISAMLMDEEDGPLSDLSMRSRGKSPQSSAMMERSQSPKTRRKGKDNRQLTEDRLSQHVDSDVKLPSIFSNSVSLGNIGGPSSSPINRSSPTFRRMDGAAAMKRQGSSTVFLSPSVSISASSPIAREPSTSFLPSPNISASWRSPTSSTSFLPTSGPATLPPLSPLGTLQDKVFEREDTEDALELSNLSNSGKKYLDTASGSGCTALHAACDKGHFDVIPLLMASGADPNLLDNGGHTPLHLLLRDLRHSKMKVTAAAEIIIGQQTTTNDMKNPLHTSRPSMLMTQNAATAAAKGRFKPNVHRPGAYTALHYACEGAYYEIVPTLLNSGASPNVPDRNGTTPLSLLLDHPPCTQISALAQVIIATKGFDPNAANASGRTLLHLASAHKHFSVVAMLMKAGADPNVPDPTEKGNLNTPLHWLLAAPIIVTNSSTSRYPKSLTVAAASIICSGRGRRGVQFDTRIRNQSGRTALHLACDYGHVDAALLLIDVGADVSATDADGSTPLHVACPNAFQLVQPLLALGADPGALDHSNRSPLDILRDRFKIISTIGGQTAHYPMTAAGGGAKGKGRHMQQPLLLSFVAPLSTDSVEGEHLMMQFDGALDILLAEGGVRYSRLGYGRRRDR